MLRNLLLVLGLLAFPLSTGCAQAYHAYNGCYVDCKYCAPSPLPYTHYQGCVCHSCAAAKHAQSGAVHVEELETTPVSPQAEPQADTGVNGAR